MDVPAAANVLGTLGAVCWSIQLIPQIVINYRRHHAIGLQPSMMMLWAWAGVPLGVYNIVQEFNVALRIQPQILTFLSLVTWIQCYYYERKWSVLRALAVVVPIAALMGGIQAGLIVALRIAKGSHLEWPLVLMAVLSAALLAAGVLTHYWDIWVHRTVRGISFIFVGIDALGDVFSLASVPFQPRLDVLGMVIYGTELVLWLGVFACGGYYNLLPWLRAMGYLGEARTPPSETVELEEPARASGVMARENPSSTSVFRTVSGESGVARPRTSRSAQQQ
ncbi:PQ loop repeat-domain-containing protein [Plectosphaerella plurivora]|uniref:PQ loop repeat-domain-containing protein n=1 Tax=Plectosphaerella plurivora TaxID=936078 RepID=A0A9P8VI46_9PEZI|nr:PQ loop repeat-domain-containing protein [Plectosphaerella plurivora]